MFIEEVDARIIKNSRGDRTIEVKITTHIGKFIASAPSGKSKGKYEVSEWNERGIEYSLKLLGSFGRFVKHKNFLFKDFEGLRDFHSEIKKFEAKLGWLGGNVTYALEVAFLRAAAAEKGKNLWEFVYDSFPVLDKKGKTKKPSMPMPVGNCIGGGMHSQPLDGKKPDFQEFLLIPKEKTFSKAVTNMIYTYQYAGKLLKKYERRILMKRNDEGAWRTALNNEQVLDILEEAGKKFKVRIGIDMATSTFFDKGYYHYKNKELIRDKKDQIEYVKKLIGKYNFIYLEDPVDEDDFAGFNEILGYVRNSDKDSLIVGDDLTVTHPTRVRNAVKDLSVNAVIIKPNQVGSLLEVGSIVKFCKENNVKMIFSHRSGETMDDALADFAVGFQADFIKTGIHGPERLIKLKRVMDIEKGLKS